MKLCTFLKRKPSRSQEMIELLTEDEGWQGAYTDWQRSTLLIGIRAYLEVLEDNEIMFPPQNDIAKLLKATPA